MYSRLFASWQQSFQTAIGLIKPYAADLKL
jgi:hypothetical protein